SAQGNGNVAPAKQPVTFVSDISPTEKATMRAALPPLYEGDQYAIGDVERGASGSAASGSQGDTAQGGGFSGTDADFAVVTPMGGTEEASVMDVKLPDDVAAILEQSAKKLNKGLNEGRKE
ncbi:MAG: hypothetical protein WAO98_07535, partial [Alphaproteobacteria bacterium]